ncbi:MAG: VWA domain-containing protein [Halioglobus sp.]
MTETLQQFHLMRPEWLWLLVPAALLALLLWRQHTRSGSWSDVIAPQLLPYLLGEQSGGKRTNLLPAILAAWSIAVVAAAGPSWERIPQPIHQKQDALVLVLDLSYSMKAADLAPSRIERARQKLLDLLTQRTEGQTGLIAFAGDAHIVTPLTDDNPTIANLLPALHPDMMPVPGSDAQSAVVLALELLQSAGIRRGQILLITDGVSQSKHSRIADLIDGSDATLAVLGVGTNVGAPIPLTNGGFLKDSAGTIVIPQLDAGSLGALAQRSGGRYESMTIADSDLERLLARSDIPGDDDTLALDRTADAWDDKGYYFILLLLPVALSLFRRGWLVCLLPLMFFGESQPAQADIWDDLWLTRDQQGQRALEAGDAEAASEVFNDPAWAGTAAYRGGAYDRAVEQFSTSEGADYAYNLGNSLARAGKIDEAIEAYRKSLEQAPDRVDAQENLALLEQLKEQQQNQEQENQDDNSDDQNEQQQDQQQEQSSGENQQQDSDSDQQQEPSQPPPEDESQPQDDQSQEQEQESEQEQDQQQEPTEQEQSSEEEQQAEPAQLSPEEQEREQAMEQWLRRVPDDPSGLLREKFRYESRLRQQQGAQPQDETYW